MKKLIATIFVMTALVATVLASSLPVTKVGGAPSVRCEAESPGKGKG